VYTYQVEAGVKQDNAGVKHRFQVLYGVTLATPRLVILYTHPGQLHKCMYVLIDMYKFKK